MGGPVKVPFDRKDVPCSTIFTPKIPLVLKINEHVPLFPQTPGIPSEILPVYYSTNIAVFKIAFWFPLFRTHLLKLTDDIAVLEVCQTKAVKRLQRL